MSDRRFWSMVLMVLLGLSLTGCGSEPVAFASLPAYPNAVEIAQGENSIADTVVETMQGAMGENLTSEVQVYNLPAADDFAAVKSFYDQQLAGGDWESVSELTTESGTFSTAGWKRGGLTSEQVLMISVIPPILDSAPVLIVSLFSE